jgi:hypothetical protein
MVGALDAALTMSYPFFGALFGCLSRRIGGQRPAEVRDPLGAANRAANQRCPGSRGIGELPRDSEFQQPASVMSQKLT